MRPCRLLPKTLAFAALAAFIAACGDDVTDPQALLDSAEAEAVLRSAAALPALPAVIERAGDPTDSRDRLALYRAQELWATGTAADDRTARARRRLAVRYAAPGLTARLGVADWDEVDSGLRQWITTAESMLRHVELPDVRDRLREAQSLLNRAATASDPGARARALLLAGAELVETTPRFVARSLTADAEAAVARAMAAADDAEDPRLQRALRLKDWAVRAVEDGDYLLAVQRAYYAVQLAEAR
ncbi:MAG TPA: hypothetical protein VMM83_00225 [Longimicrobiales bacterium]|nr:hypothetical protein [Longimicrobiales bacterium]